MPAIVCPHCKLTGNVPDSFTGKTVRCPKCKGAITVFVDPRFEECIEEVEVEVVPDDRAPIPSDNYVRIAPTREVPRPAPRPTHQEKVKEGEALAEGCVSFFLKIAIFIACCFLVVIVLLLCFAK